ncbi:MAG: hypothetical protein AAFR65_01100 [Pseudomonadota bacterium]
MSEGNLEDLVFWVQRHVAESDLVEKMGRLIAELDSVSRLKVRVPRDELRTAANNVAVTLRELLSDTDITISPKDLVAFDISGNELIYIMEFSEKISSGGEISKSRFEEVVRRNHFLFQRALDWFSISVSLSGEFPKNYSRESPHPDLFAVDIVFQQDASLSSVSDLRDWSNAWFEIGRGFTMASGERPEDLKLLGVRSGSVVLVLGATAASIKIISDATKALLSVLDDVFELRKKSIEIQRMKLENEKISRALREASQDLFRNASSKVITEIDLSNIDGETENAIRRSIDLMGKFFSEGGQLQIIAPANHENDSVITYQEITEINQYWKNRALLHEAESVEDNSSSSSPH